MLKYEISLRLAQYFHRKCHLKFFMNGCHGNQSYLSFYLIVYPPIRLYLVRNFVYVFILLSYIVFVSVHLSARLHAHFVNDCLLLYGLYIFFPFVHSSVRPIVKPPILSVRQLNASPMYECMSVTVFFSKL